jgi:hypothetical protein
MAAKVEKVRVNADGTNVENVFPYLNQPHFHCVARRA